MALEENGETTDTETEVPESDIDAGSDDGADEGTGGSGEEDGEGDGDEPQGDVPDDPDGYTLPEVEGLDAEAAAASPVVAALRRAAHKAGMTQDAFNDAITDYVTETETRAQEASSKEMKALGANAKTRIAAVNTWLGKALPADQAQALAASVTSAAAVKALEALMSKGTRRASAAAPAESGLDRTAVEKLMASPAYCGRPNQRDPKVIAQVDAYWKAQADKGK